MSGAEDGGGDKFFHSRTGNGRRKTSVDTRHSRGGLTFHPEEVFWAVIRVA